MEFFNHVTIVAGLAVMGVHQLLKLKFIPVTFANKYPVPTAIVLSIVASIIAVWQNLVAHPVAWTDWLVLTVTVLLVAAITYNMTIRNWTELKEMEG